ncbi:MAG: secretin N-terminal domain-containing protein [Gemmatimonadota bacterium]
MIGHVFLALLMTWAAAAAPQGSVREVQIASVNGATEIAVFWDGSVEVRQFQLASPTRLVVDLHGAALGFAETSFDAIGRGGITRLRSSQFRDNVVRLVFDLIAPAELEISQDIGVYRARFANPGPEFETWSSARSLSADVLAMEDRSPAATLEAHAVAVDARTMMQDALQPRITVAYDSASMLDVLAGFSEFASISIVPSAQAAGLSVRGIDIRNQPWDVALDAILSAQGLGWRRQSEGILIVDLLEGLAGRDTLLSETRVIRINYAGADSVAVMLRQLVTEGHGKVVSYQGTNSVIITDAPTVVARMDSLIRILDRPTPQVAIEAKIVFVDRTDVNELGIIYDLKDLNGNSINDIVAIPDPLDPTELTNATLVDLSGESIAALANANDPILNPALQILATVAFGDFSLIAFIDALETHQLSDVQAAPTIRVVDNHPARIQVGEKTPLRILDAGGQAAAARATVQFENTGIILEVTPHITNNGQVLLDLMAERSALQVGLADVGFTFAKQIGQSRLLLADGETAVIGGLTLSEVTRSESGIPGLMNIPILGALFRTTKNQENKKDLIILVTPHIIPAPAPAPAGQLQ